MKDCTFSCAPCTSTPPRSLPILGVTNWPLLGTNLGGGHQQEEGGGPAEPASSTQSATKMAARAAKALLQKLADRWWCKNRWAQRARWQGGHQPCQQVAVLEYGNNIVVPNGVQFVIHLRRQSQKVAVFARSEPAPTQRPCRHSTCMQKQLCPKKNNTQVRNAALSSLVNSVFVWGSFCWLGSI